MKDRGDERFDSAEELFKGIKRIDSKITHIINCNLLKVKER